MVLVQRALCVCVWGGVCMCALGDRLCMTFVHFPVDSVIDTVHTACNLHG